MPQPRRPAKRTPRSMAMLRSSSEARELLTHQKELSEITVRQLKQLLLNAAEGPMTNPELVSKRVAAETKQASLMNGFEFKLNGQKITANEIDNKLEKSTDLAERKAVWEASKEIGPALKPNLVTLRDLRNGVAKEMKYPDYFSLQVAAYGMTTDEMLKMLDDWMATLRPLYLQLHTWAKYKLAEEFHQPVPKKIPAHWIGNRWAQEWPGLVEAANIDKYLEGRKPEWIIKTAEQFYTGLGFSPLPQSFWEKSDLYPVPPDSKRKKNTHASCNHIDLENDIRSLQSIEPNSRWFFTAHHELGHGYYDKAYTRPEVPYLLRLGAAPGFHEGVGELISLASSQVPYLQSRGVLPARISMRIRPHSFWTTRSPARCRSFIFLRHDAALGGGHLRAQSYRRTNGMRAGGNTSAIFKASNRRHRAAKSFATPQPRRTSTILRRIITITRSRLCLNFSCTTTSRAKFCISRRNRVTTPITRKWVRG